jgi:hypothetical protein
MIQEIVGVFGEEAELNPGEVTDLRVKPALVTMLVDQAALLDSEYADVDYDIRSGFPDRRSIIEWYQRACVRSLGHIDAEWPPDSCFADEVMLAALLSEDSADILETEGRLGTVTAREYRRFLESTVVQPAFNRAYRTMRDSATEYVKTDEYDGDWSHKELNPETQANVAMRPGFQVLDDRQSRSLSELWGGFESTDALSEWIHALSAPANGCVPEDFSTAVTTDDVALDHLVHERETDAARRYREAFAATAVLPMFVEGMQAAEAQELAKATSETPTTLRMGGGN